MRSVKFTAKKPYIKIFKVKDKRLRTLKLARPFYRLTHSGSQDIKAIAIDSIGLKCYGQDEWALEKHGKIRQKRELRKLPITVDHHHIIQTSVLTDRKIHDMEVVNDLITPMQNKVRTENHSPEDVMILCRAYNLQFRLYSYNNLLENQFLVNYRNIDQDRHWLPKVLGKVSTTNLRLQQPQFVSISYK